jgi:hypothetical protein
MLLEALVACGNDTDQGERLNAYQQVRRLNHPMRASLQNSILCQATRAHGTSVCRV